MSQHIILNLKPLTFLTIFLSVVVSSSKTQRLTETNEILELIVSTLNQTISNVNQSSSNFSHSPNRLGPDLTHHDRCAFEDCIELLDDTIYNLKTAISKLQSTSFRSQDVNMLLSDAMTNQDTCLDGLMTRGRTYGLSESILNISNNLSKCLDMLQNISSEEELEDVDVEFPSWVLENDQRVLQAPVKETKFNLTVAKDGTGNFTTVSEAVSVAPNSSLTRFVIYIKSGEYFENVEITKKKTKIMFVGDGIGKTIIKANRTHTDDGFGWSTFQTATVGVRGEGFIAKDITFVNFAGLTKNQSVALRSGSNHSAFYRCSFEGYQDTLYVYSSLQFYRECDIYGTIDFIFGNAAVVFQNCRFFARKPKPNQSIVFTAQSRNCSKQPTGISIINCSILAAPDLIPFKRNFKAYLGRPWRNHSRTVVMKSYIGDLIDPAGWLEWGKGKDDGVENVYYGEYMNEGPGANMSGRVNWFKRIQTVKEAAQFTVGPFIDAKTWLNSTNIPFSLGF